MVRIREYKAEIVIIIGLLLFIFLSSCITERKCLRKYPPQIITKDSIVYKTIEIILYDTIYIGADTVRVTDTVYIDAATGLITSNKLVSETDYAIAYAQVINSKLFLELIQKDTAIARLLRENIQVKEIYRDRTEIVTEPCNLSHVKWYHTAALWIAIPVVLLILAYLVYRAIKLYAKIRLPI